MEKKFVINRVDLGTRVTGYEVFNPAVNGGEVLGMTAKQLSEAIKAVAPATGLKSIAGGTLVLKNAFEGKSVYLYNDDTVFYTINAKNGSVETVAARDIETSDTVQVAVVLAKGTTNDTASVVFVITPAV